MFYNQTSVEPSGLFRTGRKSKTKHREINKEDCYEYFPNRNDDTTSSKFKGSPSKQSSFKIIWNSFKKSLSSNESGSQKKRRNALEYSSLRSGPVQYDLAEKVVINISGLTFETWSWILNEHPTTLLGDPNKRCLYFDKKRQEYFFDRYRPAFESIFNYYQNGGKLKRPVNVPDDIFLIELDFYQIEKSVVDAYKRDEGHISEVIELPTNKVKRYIWMLFEFPETSVLAFILAVLSVAFTVSSIVLFCVETLPPFNKSHCVSGAAPNFLDIFFILETLCTFWFSIEVTCRFFSCPSKNKFIKDIKNIIDVAAVVPYYVTLTNVLITFSCESAKSSASLAFLRVIRLIRVFKLTKHSPGLQVLMLTFRASIEGLGLFLVALSVSIILFSSTIYYAEVGYPESQIESIPDAFWWAIITMCTVGYGDKVPKQILGKLVGSICAVSGVLTLAIPVPIITENFNKFYAHKTGRSRF